MQKKSDVVHTSNGLYSTAGAARTARRRAAASGARRSPARAAHLGYRPVKHGFVGPGTPPDRELLWILENWLPTFPAPIRQKLRILRKSTVVNKKILTMIEDIIRFLQRCSLTTFSYQTKIKQSIRIINYVEIEHSGCPIKK